MRPNIKQFNYKNVYYIDEVPTIIEKINVRDGYAYAKGYIVQDVFTLKPCFVAKRDNLFAHGDTLKEARRDLDEKIMDNMGEEEKIDLFLDNFELNKKYLAREFYNWHHTLTGSCTMGRDEFVKSHGIDLDKDKLTVQEFINLTKNSYGGEIIQELEARVNDG